MSEKKIQLFGLLGVDLTIDNWFQDMNLLISLSLSFGFLLFVVLSQVRKRRMYSKIGFLKTEKLELQYLQEDIANSRNESNNSHLDSKCLLSLLTENDSVTSKSQAHSQIIGHIGSQSIQQKKKKDIQNSQTNDIKKVVNSISFSESLSNRVRSLNQNYENVVETSHTNRENPIEPIKKEEGGDEEQKEQKQEDQINIQLRKGSVLTYFSSNNVISNIHSICGLTALTPLSMNTSIIHMNAANNGQDQQQNEILIDKNRAQLSDNYNESTESKNKPLQKEFILNTLEKKESCLSQTDKCSDTEHEQNHKIVFEIEPNKIIPKKKLIKCRFAKWKDELKRLYLRHSIILNTIMEDNVLFPRIMKILLINIYIQIVLLIVRVIEINSHNNALQQVQEMVKGKSHHVHVDIVPKDETFFEELIFSQAGACISLIIIGLLIRMCRTDRDILFFNTNNSQLLRNLLEIRESQVYKLVIAFFLCLSFGTYSFLHHLLFLQSTHSKYTHRYMLLVSIILATYLLVIDAIYLPLLALLRISHLHIARHLRNCLIKLSFWTI